MAGCHVEDVLGLVAHSLAVALLVGMGRLAAMGGMSLADAGELQLALGDLVGEVEELPVAVDHSLNPSRMVFIISADRSPLRCGQR